MEKLLIRINEKMAGNVISEEIFQKAKAFHDNSVKSMLSAQKVIKTSNGWFKNSKKRTGINNVIHEHTASFNSEAAAKFVRKITDNDRCDQKKMFKCNEIRFLWKKMSR